jgi:glycosyltransferase involved in cell wall biosynthesis
MSTIKISALIPTYNRSDLLPKAIESLLHQSLDRSLYEIIVIDNASTDATKQVCDRYISEKNFRYIFEPEQGLNISRVTGARESRGKYVAYIDDDAIASTIWLEKILYGFECVTPKPGSVGGKISPIWEIPKPNWFPDFKGPYLTILNYGDQPQFISYPKILFGTNMAFEKELLFKFDAFRVDLDRQKRKLLGGGDSWAFKVFADNAVPVYYLPEALVHHLVPKERATKKWLYNRHYWQGRTEVALLSESDRGLDRKRELCEAFKMIRTHVKQYIDAKREDEKFTHVAILKQQLGRIVQVLSATKG